MSDTTMTRRRFVRDTLAAGAALGALGPRFALADGGAPAAGKIGDFKISLAQWSLHKALFQEDVSRRYFGKVITNLDFPQVTREQFGIDAVEFVNQFFKDKARDSAYLENLKRRAIDQGVTCVLIMIDGEGDLSAESRDERTKAVQNHKKWVDAAAVLGCHAIRVNTGNHYSPTDTSAAAEACGELTDYGTKNKVHIICENHGGPSSDPDALLALIKAVGKDGFGTLPDFGNFPKNRQGKYTLDVYDAIARMMPHAKGVSAKSYDFDDAGNESNLDFARILKIVTDAGYKGHVGIEYEGSRLSEPEGIKATKTLLDSLRGATYTPKA